ncbi:dna repair protein reca like protein 2 [Quercus suber]|uniref:Dna repair protein reca like protein 2 n=1 Tax=Quercus suber TaxID=58331 RepID=A0AAW0KZV6_QUESU
MILVLSINLCMGRKGGALPWCFFPTPTGVTGLGVCVQVVKNNLAPSMKKAEFGIQFGRGFCYEAEVLELACEHGVIVKEGSNYLIEGKLFSGKHEAEQFLVKNDGILDKMVKILRRQLFERERGSR